MAILRYTADDLDPPAPGPYPNKVSLYVGTDIKLTEGNYGTVAKVTMVVTFEFSILLHRYFLGGRNFRIVKMSI